MNISLLYGNGTISAQLPNNRELSIISCHLDEYAAGAAELELVQASMKKSIGSPPLARLAKGKKKVVLLAGDHTRPVPSKIIVPCLLDEIRRGNPNAEVTILIATGCHRGTTKEELILKFGRELCLREKIVVHDCMDEANLVKVGTLPSGGELILSRLAVEADLLVAEGFIEPHFFAGFSGGRKSVLPGVASCSTVYYNHNAAFIGDKHSRSGVLDGNLIHKDMIYAAKKVNLAYIVNVVINSRKEVIASFAGDCDEAHLAGCRFLVNMVSAAAVPADIVITTNNGFPLDQNIYQAVKGMSTAEATCKPGGVIIEVAECRDGYGGDGFYRMFRDNPSAKDILDTIRKTQAKDTVEDQWQAQILARILSKHKVILVSEMPPDIVRDLHMIPAGTVEEALWLADGFLKREGTICVIPEGVTQIIW